MFRVTRYPMISKTESGRVGYQKKYRVAGRVRVPAGHCSRSVEVTEHDRAAATPTERTGGWGAGSKDRDRFLQLGPPVQNALATTSKIYTSFGFEKYALQS